MNNPNKVILHCSATPDYHHNDDSFDLFGKLQIRHWHVEERGWDDIGYHFIVRRTGVLETGRDLNVHGAHCHGQNNTSVGICYIGTFRPTDKQITTLINLYGLMKQRFEIGYDDWYGHHDFKSTECPGFLMKNFRDLLKKSDKLTVS